MTRYVNDCQGTVLFVAANKQLELKVQQDKKLYVKYVDITVHTSDGSSEKDVIYRLEGFTAYPNGGLFDEMCGLKPGYEVKFSYELASSQWTDKLGEVQRKMRLKPVKKIFVGGTSPKYFHVTNYPIDPEPDDLPQDITDDLPVGDIGGGEELPIPGVGDPDNDLPF